MNNAFYFLRHAQTEWKENLPARRWVLSEKGRKDADELASSGVFDNINVIISSREKKACQTASPIATRLGKEISRFAELNDLYKEEVPLEEEDFMKTIELSLRNPHESLHGWETADHALERFRRKIEKIDSDYEGKNILVVSHGCVLSLYFARILCRLDEAYERWSKTSFCAWGVIKNGKVIKDIVEE